MYWLRGYGSLLQTGCFWTSLQQCFCYNWNSEAVYFPSYPWVLQQHIDLKSVEKSVFVFCYSDSEDVSVTQTYPDGSSLPNPILHSAPRLNPWLDLTNSVFSAVISVSHVHRKKRCSYGGGRPNLVPCFCIFFWWRKLPLAPPCTFAWEWHFRRVGGWPLFDKLQIYRPEKVIVLLILHVFTRSRAAGEVDVVLWYCH